MQSLHARNPDLPANEVIEFPKDQEFWIAREVSKSGTTTSSQKSLQQEMGADADAARSFKSCLNLAKSRSARRASAHGASDELDDQQGVASLTVDKELMATTLKEARSCHSLWDGRNRSWQGLLLKSSGNILTPDSKFEQTLATYRTSGLANDVKVQALDNIQI